MHNDQLHANVLGKVVDGEHRAAADAELRQRLQRQRVVTRHFLGRETVATLVDKAARTRTRTRTNTVSDEPASASSSGTHSSPRISCGWLKPTSARRMRLTTAPSVVLLVSSVNVSDAC